MTADRLRKLLALGLIFLPLAGVLVAVLLADMPDPVPSHWNIRGEVDRTMGLTVFTVLSLVLTGGAALVAVGFARAERPRLGVTAFAFAAYLMGSLAVLTTVVASGAASAEQVDLAWPGVAGSVAVVLLGPGLVWLLWPEPAAVEADGPAADLPRLDLAPGERVVYITEVRSRGFLLLAVGCAVIGLVLATAVDLLIGSAVLAVTVAGLMLQRATVRIDAEGLRVGFGPGVRVLVPLADIKHAAPAQIRPMEWGGWGYRVIPGRRGVILRGGPGLVLNLVDGTRFAVTVDDPRDAAAVLNGLVARGASSG